MEYYNYIKSVFVQPEVSKSAIQQVKEYIVAHPQVIYKGVPVAVAAYYAIPILVLTWTWLPWIYIGYEIHHRVDIINTGYDYYAKLRKLF